MRIYYLLILLFFMTTQAFTLQIDEKYPVDVELKTKLLKYGSMFEEKITELLEIEASDVNIRVIPRNRWSRYHPIMPYGCTLPTKTGVDIPQADLRFLYEDYFYDIAEKLSQDEIQELSELYNVPGASSFPEILDQVSEAYLYDEMVIFWAYPAEIAGFYLNKIGFANKVNESIRLLLLHTIMYSITPDELKTKEWGVRKIQDLYYDYYYKDINPVKSFKRLLTPILPLSEAQKSYFVVEGAFHKHFAKVFEKDTAFVKTLVKVLLNSDAKKTENNDFVEIVSNILGYESIFEMFESETLPKGTSNFLMLLYYSTL
ncbi:MAG: hypothetical protein ABIA04_01825 [Pseudomonadota bacterium]